MADKTKENAIRDFVDALSKKDVARAMTFFTPDAVWTNTEGVFTGTGEIEEYTRWMVENLSNLSFADTGVGIISEGDNAIFEYAMEGTYEGNTVKVNGVCTYQFEGDKCKRHCTVADRLAMANQAAGGFIAKKAVKSIISTMEKGLR